MWLLVLLVVQWHVFYAVQSMNHGRKWNSSKQGHIRRIFQSPHAVPFEFENVIHRQVNVSNASDSEARLSAQMHENYWQTPRKIRQAHEGRQADYRYLDTAVKVTQIDIKSPPSNQKKKQEMESERPPCQILIILFSFSFFTLTGVVLAFLVIMHVF